MTVYPKRAPHTLSDPHRRMLEKDSAITSEVIAERGYETVRSRAKLLEFKKYQRRAPALRVPVYSPDGTTTTAQLRPDNPRQRDGKTIKYETPADSACILDVHPRMREAVRSGSGDLWITEGIKKADALTSQGLPTIGIIGVWNWQRGGELLPCWDHVQLRGRTVNVVFDSDVMVKPEVQLALERLAAALTHRGAEVQVVYLPDASGGAKAGVDDYLAAGHTVGELRILSRKYEPSDVGKIRMSKDAKLGARVKDLWRRWWEFDWARLVGTSERPNSMRGHTCRDVMKVLIDATARHGKITAGGPRVSLGRRTIALRAATSLRTVHKAIKHLEAEGWLEFQPPASEERPGAYLLHATLHQVGSKEGPGESAVTRELQSSDVGGEDLRSPRLRWPYVARVWTPEGFEYEYIRRLGKIRCAVLDVLDRRAGGAATVGELASAFNKRPYDLRTRTLPMLEEAGIVQVADDLVSLTDNWLEALECERALKGEIAARRRDESRYGREREAYRNRHKVKADPAPSEQELAVGREDRLKAREVDKLVTQGMARSFARAVVFKDSDPFGNRDPRADGFITELEVPSPRPPQVGGIYQHGPDCWCAWCAEEVEPRYAPIRGTA